MEVTTAPAGARLLLDGRMLEARSPARLQVSAGVAHTLAVRTGSRTGVAQRFVLDVGEEATMNIDLRKMGRPALKKAEAKRSAPPPTAIPAAVPAPAPAPPKKEGEGTLVVESSPWCNVSVDHVASGTTPLSVKLAAGSHEVVLTNSEFKIRRTLQVEIEGGRMLRKRLDFAPE
jgi:hypothetical protein